MNITIPIQDGQAPEAIKVNGECYRYVSSEAGAAEQTDPSETFDNCSDCAASSEAQSSGAGSDNPCGSLTCPTVNGFVNPPSMQIRIEDPDYFIGDPSIVWCGKTWTPTEIQNGVTKCVCPTTYNLGVHPNQSNAKQHDWENDIGGGNGLLRMHRTAINGGPQYYQPDRNRLQVSNVNILGNSDEQVWFFTPYGTPTMDYSKTINLGVLATGAPPQPVFGGNYQITDDFFGSYVTNGVTYSWQKGLNW